MTLAAGGMIKGLLRTVPPRATASLEAAKTTYNLGAERTVFGYSGIWVFGYSGLRALSVLYLAYLHPRYVFSALVTVGVR